MPAPCGFGTVVPMKRWLSNLSRRAAERPFALDVTFAAIVGAVSLIGLLSAEPNGTQQAADAFAVVIIGVQTIGFAFRRQHVLSSYSVVIAATLVFWVADYATNFDAVSLLAVYSATAHGGENRALVWRFVGAGVAAMTVIAVIGVLVPSEDLPAVAVVGIAAIHLTAAVAGELVHDRRLSVGRLEQRAQRAEAERELLARQAVSDERSRIARDLHDVVAHGMSVMVVQAGAAARVLHTDPNRAATALDHIQATGREALTEMRRMLDVLRESDSSAGPLTPQPSLGDLERVVRHCTDAGVPTELIVRGDVTTHSPGHEMAAYRIVQEALTNVIKHAGRPARARVTVTHRPDRIAIEVLDDGVGAADETLARSVGHGIVGMRERAELYRGTLHAGRRPGGGFRISASLPDATAHPTSLVR